MHQREKAGDNFNNHPFLEKKRTKKPKKDFLRLFLCLFWKLHPVNQFFDSALPPRYSLTSSPGEETFEVKIVSPTEPMTRIWIQVLDRRDGSFLVRYRMYATYTDVHIHILLKSKHVAKSPFVLKGRA